MTQFTIQSPDVRFPNHVIMFLRVPLQSQVLAGFNLQDFSWLQFSGEHSKAQKHWHGHSCQTNWC